MGSADTNTVPLRPASCMPIWLCAKLKENMHVDQEIADSVGFVGFHSEHGFCADGTCFFVAVHEETEQFHYFVTARHLVRPLNSDGSERELVDGTVLVRLSRGTKPPLIQKTIRSEWVCPSDRHIDLAILPFDYRAAGQDGDLHFHAFIVISPNHGILYNEQPHAHGKMRMGDDVFIPSVFSGHVGEQHNIPVIRFGHVASLPLEPMRYGSPTVPAFLIETRSLGGISGAPVLLHLDPGAPRNSPKGHESGNIRMVPYALIGMVLGAHGGGYGTDFAADPDGTTVNADAQFNAGLSLVLPMQHVLDLLQSEALARPRATALEEIKRVSGFRPTAGN